MGDFLEALDHLHWMINETRFNRYRFFHYNDLDSFVVKVIV